MARRADGTRRAEPPRLRGTNGPDAIKGLDYAAAWTWRSGGNDRRRHSTKLSDAQVFEMRIAYVRDGVLPTELAKHYGLSVGGVRRALRPPDRKGASYTWVAYPTGDDMLKAD